MFATFLRNLVRKPVSRPLARSTRLQVEALEDRAAPSALLAADAFDTQSGDVVSVSGGKIGDGMNDGDDFTGRRSVELMGGKIGDGINDGDDFTGGSSMASAIDWYFANRGGEEIPTLAGRPIGEEIPT